MKTLRKLNSFECESFISDRKKTPPRRMTLGTNMVKKETSLCTTNAMRSERRIIKRGAKPNLGTCRQRNGPKIQGWDVLQIEPCTKLYRSVRVASSPPLSCKNLLYKANSNDNCQPLVCPRLVYHRPTCLSQAFFMAKTVWGIIYSFEKEIHNGLISKRGDVMKKGFLSRKSDRS